MSFSTLTLSADTRTLTDRFLATPVGATIRYSDMSAAIGADIQARRHLILRAIAIASREAGAIFGSVRGVGYKRLASEDASVVGAHARHRIRSTARRSSRVIQRAVEVANDMSEPARVKAYAEISALSLIQHVATDKARSAVSISDKPQPVAITLRAMMDQIKAA